MENKKNDRTSITIKDVARLAGVSISTASYALNNVPKVNEETKKRILRAADELSFQPNPAARSLKGKLTGTIGVFLPEIRSPYYLDVIAGLEDELQRRDIDLIVARIGHGRSTAYNLLKERRVDGGIILGGSFLYREVLGNLIVSGVPLVITDYPADEVPGDPGRVSYLLVDNVSGIRSALIHLFSRGIRRIGFLAGNPASFDNMERFGAYRDFLSEYGIPYDERLVLPGDFSEDEAYRQVKTAIAEKRLPEAWCCANDQMAFGALNALKSAGLRVPEDISLTGFDDLHQSSMMDPPLTTIHRDELAMGRLAVDRLYAIIEGRPFERVTVMPVMLVVRQSA
jgi:LacI family transcriptional regulator